MWSLFFHFGWLFLLAPLVMLVVCMLMCGFVCRPSRTGGMGCCGHHHSSNVGNSSSPS